MDCPTRTTHGCLRCETGSVASWLDEQQAERAGLTPNQHQLLLAIHGHDDPRGPTVGEVADYLLLRHHSTVELIDRADTAGWSHASATRRPPSRTPQPHQRRRERLETLSAMHLEELDRLSLQLPAAWKGLSPFSPPMGCPTPDPTTLQPTFASRPTSLERLYTMAHQHQLVVSPLQRHRALRSGCAPRCACSNPTGRPHVEAERPPHDGSNDLRVRYPKVLSPSHEVGRIPHHYPVQSPAFTRQPTAVPDQNFGPTLSRPGRTDHQHDVRPQQRAQDGATR